MMPGIQPKGPSMIVNSEKTRDSIANVDVYVLFIKFFIERRANLRGKGTIGTVLCAAKGVKFVDFPKLGSAVCWNYFSSWS